jgi:hypothetical protein
MQVLYQKTRLQPAGRIVPTFPSWRPDRAIDHILVSEGLDYRTVEAVRAARSDHLALALDPRAAESAALSAAATLSNRCLRAGRRYSAQAGSHPSHGEGHGFAAGALCRLGGTRGGGDRRVCGLAPTRRPAVAGCSGGLAASRSRHRDAAPGIARTAPLQSTPSLCAP